MRNRLGKVGISDWLVLVGVVVVAVGLCWLAIGAIWDRGIPLWGLFFTVVVGLVAGASDWLTREAPTGGFGWRRWISVRSAARLGMAIFFGFGTAFFAQSFFEPRAAVESRTGIIESEVTQARATLDDIAGQLAPRPWRAFEKIGGLWGEAGCRVVYRFEAGESAVRVVLVEREPGMAAYEMAASINGGEGDVIHATVETSTEGDEPGDSLIFTYTGNGAVERLTWLNRSHPDVGGLELDRCGVTT